MPQILKSKKFQAAAGTIVGLILAQVGLDIDPELVVKLIAGITSAYLVSQGAADFSKEK